MSDSAPSRVPTAAHDARRASAQLEAMPAAARADLLRQLATALEDEEARRTIFAANARDMEAAKAAMERGELSSALVGRLGLPATKLDGLCTGLRQLADMPTLVGRRQVHRRLDEGLVLERIACPLGVLGVVFEARPDALVQIAGLALASANAVLLKGGSEALQTNQALHAVIAGVLDKAGVDAAAVTLLINREEFGELLACHADVDLIVARGSGRFVQMVMDNTKIPVMGHAEGLCHLYLHADAAPEMAARIAVDAKTSYPSACNSIETLLWHEDAGEALDAAVTALREAGVEVRGDEKTRVRHPDLVPASEADWSTEYTDLILSVRAVADFEAALTHIARHGSKHTEAIITADAKTAERFLAAVDAAGVFWNASTRFADGFRYGLGAEVGVSTQKLHARGPVGLEGLLSYRWLLRGQGQVTADYGAGKRAFMHEELG